MNGELLAVLEHIEREKGIKRQVLIEAIESALVSAARKVIGEKEKPITVKVDNETGAIKVFSGETEISSDEFGRIAAQTAKQVIIQKIREAERDVIYDDFHAREGSIVNGTVHRFEKGSIIVDLGKTEGILFKKEIPSKETYRQGDRIKAYITEVKKTTKGPQIILSRAHSGFVKKLFELEVPEIYEGIVEIKSISREAGDRTKIAVWSKDPKVDAVGACVGMRGQRVKDIVRELQNEKIDIVRWSEDIKEYIQGALSPAKVLEITADSQGKKANVIVEDDQLSLAIGKRGQNVRLAAKLTGWNIDIKSKPEKAKKEIKEEVKEELVQATEGKKETKEEGKEKISIADLEGIGPKIQKALIEAGFDTPESIAGAKIEDLCKIKGIGEKTAAKIKKAAENKLNDKKDAK